MMTSKKKPSVTRLLQDILRSQGRALQVECLREDDQLRYEFRARIGPKGRAIIERVSRSAVDDSSVNDVKPEVNGLIRRFVRRFSVVRFDPKDVQMFPRVFEGVELPLEGNIYAYVKGSGEAGATPKEVADRFLEIGLARGRPLSVTSRIREILDHLTMRQAYFRVYRGRGGRYRFGRP